MPQVGKTTAISVLVMFRDILFSRTPDTDFDRDLCVYIGCFKNYILIDY